MRINLFLKNVTSVMNCWNGKEIVNIIQFKFHMRRSGKMRKFTRICCIGDSLCSWLRTFILQCVLTRHRLILVLLSYGYIVQIHIEQYKSEFLFKFNCRVVVLLLNNFMNIESGNVYFQKPCKNIFRKDNKKDCIRCNSLIWHQLTS